MKVKQLLNKLKANSNCDIFVQGQKSENIVQLSKYEIAKLEGITMEMNIATFEITNNIVTIYVK